MQVRRRRRWNAVLLAGGGLAIGGTAVAGAYVGDTERVASYWASAEVSAGLDATITEVIDYDFGPLHRRGIYLDVRDLEPTAEVTVESPTAPADLDLSPAPTISGTRIRIGDPDTTVTGRHRYQVRYPLGVEDPLDVALGTDEGRMSWNAVGTHWEVGIGETEIHVTAPWTWEEIRCSQGRAGSDEACLSMEQVEPGHLVATTGPLDSGRGATISAVAGAPLPATPVVEPPQGPATDPGTDPIAPGGAAVVGALVATGVVSRLVRRAGRERVSAGGAADAAWGGPSGGGGERRVDHADLHELATIEFAPPERLTPSQGGVILREEITHDHKTAWLISAAIDGGVELEERGKKIVLRRGAGNGKATEVFAPLFKKREEVELGSYDADFSRAWTRVGSELEKWMRSSRLWDRAGDKRHEKVARRGWWALVLGTVGVAVGGALAARWSTSWVALVAVAAAAAGAGLAAITRSWELRVRTPAGTAAWLRVESFRRFLAQSEAEHARQAAERGVLREYTAWAVALGEVRRWSRATAAAGLPPGEDDVAYTSMAPSLARATSSSATAPSSSSGSGGGSVGGGSGGSGGGSW